MLKNLNILKNNPLTPINPLDGISRLLRLFYLIGIWPNSNSSGCYKFYGEIIKIIFMFIFEIGIFVNIITIKDLKQSTQILCTSITELLLLIKLLVLLWSRKQIEELFEKMRLHLTLDTGSTLESLKIKDGIRHSQKLYIALLLGYLASAAAASFVALVSGENVMPIPSWFLLDYKHNKTHYWICFVYQVVGMVVHSPILAGIDTLPSCLMRIVGGYYDALGMNLKMIGNSMGERKLKYGVCQREIKDRNLFRKCEQKLVNLKFLLRIIEKTFSKILFIQFCVGGFVICMTVYQISISTVTKKYNNIFFMMTYLISILSSIFMPCYFGNEILIKNTYIIRCIYSSRWTRMSVSFQKDILILIEGIKREDKIRAGSFLDASLGTFTSIINFTYSLYTLLVNMGRKV